MVTTTSGITTRQQQVLEVIVDHWRTSGRGPTLGEIGAALEIGVSTVQGHVEALVSAGKVKRSANKWRSLEPTEHAAVGPMQVRELLTLARRVAGGRVSHDTLRGEAERILQRVNVCESQ